MRDLQDSLDVAGVPRVTPERREAGERPRRRFLAVWYRCCHTYGRLYRNSMQTAYEGRCPACGASVQATIGQGGSSRGVFEAQ
jgi:hypothetical protein